jgi:signal transduction histidine kinase
MGFNTGDPTTGHLGIRSMRERAERAGGTLQVQSQVGQGTRVEVRIPVRNADAQSP